MRTLPTLVYAFLGLALVIAPVLLVVSISGSFGSILPGEGLRIFLLRGSAFWLACLVTAAVLGGIECLIQSGIDRHEARRACELIILKDRVADARPWQLAACPHDMLRRLVAHGLVDDRELRLFSCACIRLAKVTRDPDCDIEDVISSAVDRADGKPDPLDEEEFEILTGMADNLDHLSVVHLGMMAPK